MKPYYQDSACTIYHGDCREVLPLVERETVVICDPPYNIGYHYKSYIDNVSKKEYAELISVAARIPSVIIHYPEDMFLISDALASAPSECAAWTYNANTPRKWRMVAWFGIVPNFNLVKQPFKNPSDKRIAAKICGGIDGCALYDWWHDEQVKNVSEEKTDHPCQIPISIMKKIIGITPAQTILDPFMGSGTTLRAAKDLGRKAIGIEIEEKYCEIAAKRLQQEVMNFGEPPKKIEAQQVALMGAE